MFEMHASHLRLDYLGDDHGDESALKRDAHGRLKEKRKNREYRSYYDVTVLYNLM